MGGRRLLNMALCASCSLGFLTANGLDAGEPPTGGGGGGGGSVYSLKTQSTAQLSTDSKRNEKIVFRLSGLSLKTKDIRQPQALNI